MKQKYFSKNHRNLLFFYLPLSLWIFLIWFLSSHNWTIHFYSDTWNQEMFIRKLAHIGEFFILFILIFRMISLREKKFSQSVIGALGIVFCISIIDEWHQTWVFGREGKIGDVFIDMSGAFLGSIVLIEYYRYIQKKNKK
ncbi:MAG: VanZ family protein [Candidatus Moraniibacteriota bacterium]|nr:MAG: VanZ family protein [Candidatus Moranbacteria bacterium]